MNELGRDLQIKVDRMHDRVKKARDVLAPQPFPFGPGHSEEQAIAITKNMIQKVPASRSELRIDTEQERVLSEQVNAIRASIMTDENRLNPSDSDAQEQLASGYMSLSDVGNRYSVKPKDASIRGISADVHPSPSLTYPSRLFLAGDGEGFSTNIDFDFENNVEISIFFEKPGERLGQVIIDAQYNSGSIPLDSLTDEEFAVAAHFLSEAMAITQPQSSQEEGL